MKADEVLDGECGHEGWCGGTHLVVKLLARTPEGEGVYIAPDGTLMRLEADTCDCGECNTLYRLVSIEGDDRG